jgi:hypothetical protein
MPTAAASWEQLRNRADQLAGGKPSRRPPQLDDLRVSLRVLGYRYPSYACYVQSVRHLDLRYSLRRRPNVGRLCSGSGARLRQQ